MKTIKRIFAAALTLALTLNLAFANQSKYSLNISNLKYTSARTLEFDIVMKNTGNTKEAIKYSAGQYFLEFNTKVSNGGILTYSLINSDLPETFRPVNASISGNLLRLASNMPQTENAPEISSEGTLIARMKLVTSSDKFSSEPLNLSWAGNENKFRTTICAASGNLLTDITNPESHIIDFPDVSSSVSQEIKNAPKEFTIAQNYPNPFNPVTKINFEIPVSNFVTLKVYDISGREVATLVNQNMTAGSYSSTFNGAVFASGMYFYKIQAGSFSVVKKMLLIK